VADRPADWTAALFLQLLKAKGGKINFGEAEMKIGGKIEKRMVPYFIAIFFVLAMILPRPSEAQLKLPDTFCGQRS
jgi:hypothetical protein